MRSERTRSADGIPRVLRCHVLTSMSPDIRDDRRDDDGSDDMRASLYLDTDDVDERRPDSDSGAVWKDCGRDSEDPSSAARSSSLFLE